MSDTTRFEALTTEEINILRIALQGGLAVAPAAELDRELWREQKKRIDAEFDHVERALIGGLYDGTTVRVPHFLHRFVMPYGDMKPEPLERTQIYELAADGTLKPA